MLYGALQQGIRDLTNIVRENQMFAAQNQQKQAELAIQHEHDQAVLGIQLAEAERVQKARQIYAEQGTKLLSLDPWTDLNNQYTKNEATLAGLKEEQKKYSKNWRDAGPRLGIKQRMEVVSAHQEKLQNQMADPVGIANMYQTKASQLQQLAATVGQYDVQSATLFQTAANQALDQSNLFIAQARLAKDGSKAAPVEDQAVPVNKNGEIVGDILNVAYGKNAGEAGLPRDKSKRIAALEAKNPGVRYIWKSQYDALHKSTGSQSDQAITDVLNQGRILMLGQKNIVDPNDEQNAMLSFPSKLYLTYVNEAQQKTGQKITDRNTLYQLNLIAQQNARSAHNYYIKKGRKEMEAKMIKELDGLYRSKKMTKDEYEAQKALIPSTLDNAAMDKFGYLPIDNWDKQLKYGMQTETEE